MNTCPCCSDVLLRHFKNHREYWFCRHCWQEMPLFENNNLAFRSQYWKLEKLLEKEARTLVSQ